MNPLLPTGTIVYVKSETFTVVNSYASVPSNTGYIYALKVSGKVNGTDHIRWMHSTYITGYKLQSGVIKVI